MSQSSLLPSIFSLSSRFTIAFPAHAMPYLHNLLTILVILMTPLRNKLNLTDLERGSGWQASEVEVITCLTCLVP
jgi:hypothetical protein